MNRIKFEMMLLALLAGVFLGRSTDSIARGDAYEFFDTLVDVRSEITRYYYEEPDQKKMMEGAIEGMVNTLNDPHTTYFSPEVLKAFDKQTRGSFSGIGAEISSENGLLTIVSPLEDSPAFKAGIQAGDVIMLINGEATDGLTTQQAVEKITGPEGTDVVLKIRHVDGMEKEITITRKRIQIQTVKGFTRDGEHHWDFMLDKEAKIGYVRITQFSDPTADALKEALDKLKADGAKGLIIDLRFNPGGLLEQAIRISDMFLKSGRIVSTKGRTSPERVWDAQAETEADFPLIVMVNEFSASASEIVSGALKDNGRATILGTRSYGKGSVQQVMGLRSGAGAIKLTTAHYYLPSGRNIHKLPGADVWGVDPNDGFYVPMNLDQIRKMNEMRRDSDVIRGDDGKGGDLPERITPEWLKDKQADLQLSAALESMLAKVSTGDFKKVGASNATLMAYVTERDMLEQQRKRGLEAMAKINEKIKELDDKVAHIKAGEKIVVSPDVVAPAPDLKVDKPAKDPAPANN
ncbi:MAG: PDZ domain-containing protein [Phycisphaera sp.]|nr:PDZ domain-containing protein [Phycisphaera sp.]